MLLNAVALSVSVVCLLVSAFDGWAVFRYQKLVVDESLPTLIVADCPEVTNERLRFDELASARSRLCQTWPWPSQWLNFR